jgi:hypothetical protein
MPSPRVNVRANGISVMPTAPASIQQTHLTLLAMPIEN